MATHHHLIALTIISIVSVVATGITIDLIGRDSPHSPLYSNSTCDVDKLYDAFHRSILRARELARRGATTRAARPSSSITFNAPVYPGSGDYLVNLTIGTPKRPFLAILDTGSDLTWTQCLPCEQCFNQTLPIFDPSRSTSYGPAPCDSAACHALHTDYRGTCNPTCTYTMVYDDGSSSSGDLATESLILGRADITNFTIGCGHRNQGLYMVPEMGVFGLGQGPLSFPSETKGIPAFGGKFTYCLIPNTGWRFKGGVKSKVSFGDDAVVSGPGAVTIPMASGPVESLYYLTLEGVSVGENKQRKAHSRYTDIYTNTTRGPQQVRAKYNNTIYVNKNVSCSGPGKNAQAAGNMFIDSGTTLTFLPEGMFNKLLSELKRQIKAVSIADPRGTLQLCYKGLIEAPYIIFHFAGVDLRLPMENTFVTVRRDVVCLAMSSTTELGDLDQSGVGIFGNMAQANFIVAHDIVAKTITFKAADCKTYVP